MEFVLRYTSLFSKSTAIFTLYHFIKLSFFSSLFKADKKFEYKAEFSTEKKSFLIISSSLKIEY